MLDLALHILDIAQNSTRARAGAVVVTVEEDTERDLLSLEIRDDGIGMTEAEITRALDPFYTTKKVRRVGLGLPMLKDAAERTGGGLEIKSSAGKGTRVSVTFGLSHIDRQPIGDIGLSLVTLISGNPEVDFVYIRRRDGREFRFNTRDVKRELEDIPIYRVEVLSFIRTYIDQGTKEINASA